MKDISIDGPSGFKPLPQANSPKRSGGGFGEQLKDAFTEVNRLQHTADASIEQVVRGNKGIHEGMLAIGKADLSLKLMLQVRNKAMEAYREIMRMPI